MWPGPVAPQSKGKKSIPHGDVTTAAQGAPLVTVDLEAVLVELPFAALSAVIAVKLLAAGTPKPGSPLE